MKKVCVFMLVAVTVVAAQAEIIMQDDFSGSATQLLNGQTADIG